LPRWVRVYVIHEASYLPVEGPMRLLVLREFFSRDERRVFEVELAFEELLPGLSGVDH